MPGLVILLFAVSAFAGKRTSRFNSLNAMGDLIYTLQGTDGDGKEVNNRSVYEKQ